MISNYLQHHRIYIQVKKTKIDMDMHSRGAIGQRDGLRVGSRTAKPPRRRYSSAGK